MEQARRMVSAYAAAGFDKLHLDASMACADDPPSLSPALVAERAAQLCEVAESVAPASPVYVIGTEVPTPGGARETAESIAVTPPEQVRETLELHRASFARHGLEAAFARVAAIVVQPGVEFHDAGVIAFEPEAARPLVEAANAGVIFEAHSTDYQREAALRELVQSRFAILKVGPELTFAMREALFGLDAIEAEWLASSSRAKLRETVEAAMLREPRWWRDYATGDANAQRLSRNFGFADRIRYYWSEPAVQEAVRRLLANLEAKPPPTLISQFVPVQYQAIQEGTIPASPVAIVRHRIDAVLGRYWHACGEMR